VLAPTKQRVEFHTSPFINEEIRSSTAERVTRIAEDGPAAVDARLRQLDREWTIERVIEVEAPLMVATGIALGAVDRRWRVLTLFAASMLLLHNTRGWYPLLPILRRLRFRTQREIATERYALKALRGDFDRVESPADAFAAAAIEGELR
jgi:hypothetical protein